MTDEQKYQEVLKELGSLLKAKNDRIFFQDCEIKALKEKLKLAEN